MRDMVMHMTGSNGLLGVPNEHLPGLVALVMVGPAVWLGLAALGGLAARGVRWAAAMQRRWAVLGFPAKVALLGLLVGAVVHAVLVPTHWGGERITALLFVVAAVGCALVGVWTFFRGRGWRLASVAALGGTSCAYAFFVVRGWENMDLVGLVTSTIEAAAALIVLVPVAAPSARRQYAVALSAVPVALLSLLGTAVIASASTTSGAAPAAAPAKAAKTAATHGTAGDGMAGMRSSKGTTALSLPTTSPAGRIQWPDDMTNMAAGMAMAEPNCTATPTAAQQRAAVTLVDRTVAAARKYTSLSAAKAAGYVPVTPSGRRIVHYINPALYRSGTEVDPAAIPALVYVNTSHGAVLAAAMYLTPQGTTPPQPGGCLTQWHIHTDLCFRDGRVVGTDASSSCAPGSSKRVTRPMMHVWLVPVSGGPLAPDPPPLSEVQAASQVPALTPANGTA